MSWFKSGDFEAQPARSKKYLGKRKPTWYSQQDWDKEKIGGYKQHSAQQRVFGKKLDRELYGRGYSIPIPDKAVQFRLQSAFATGLDKVLDEDKLIVAPQSFEEWQIAKNKKYEDKTLLRHAAIRRRISASLALTSEDPRVMSKYHSRNDLRTHYYFYAFLHQMHPRARKVVSEYFAVSPQGRFIMQKWNFNESSPMNIKAWGKHANLPHGVRTWFGLPKREIMAAVKFMIAYNRFHGTRTMIQKATSYSAKNFDIDMVQWAQNWLKNKSDYDLEETVEMQKVTKTRSQWADIALEQLNSDNGNKVTNLEKFMGRARADAPQKTSFLENYLTGFLVQALFQAKKFNKTSLNSGKMSDKDWLDVQVTLCKKLWRIDNVKQGLDGEMKRKILMELAEILMAYTIAAAPSEKRTKLAGTLDLSVVANLRTIGEGAKGKSLSEVYGHTRKAWKKMRSTNLSNPYGRANDWDADEKFGLPVKQSKSDLSGFDDRSEQKGSGGGMETEHFKQKNLIQKVMEQAKKVGQLGPSIHISALGQQGQGIKSGAQAF